MLFYYFSCKNNFLVFLVKILKYYSL
jgi:hypothetical protein